MVVVMRALSPHLSLSCAALAGLLSCASAPDSAREARADPPATDAAFAPTFATPPIDALTFAVLAETTELSEAQRHWLSALAQSQAAEREQAWRLAHPDQAQRRAQARPLDPPDCRITRTDEGHFSVGPHRLFLPTPRHPEEPADPERRDLPQLGPQLHRSHGMLWWAVSLERDVLPARIENREPSFSLQSAFLAERLWQTDCARPTAPLTSIFYRPGAHLGASALSPDQKILVFREQSHLTALQLQTLQSQNFPSPSLGLPDPIRWTDAGLEVHFWTDEGAAASAFEGHETLRVYRMLFAPTEERPGQPAEMRWQPRLTLRGWAQTPSALYLTLSLDSARQYGLAPQLLWRSTDEGRTWQPLSLQLDRDAEDHDELDIGLGQILAAPEQPGKLLVLPHNLERWHSEASPRHFYLSHDGGERWQKRPLPSPPDACGLSCFFDQIQALDGHLEHLRIRAIPGDPLPLLLCEAPRSAKQIAAVGCDPPHSTFFFESRDGGQTWQPTAHPTAPTAIPTDTPLPTGAARLAYTPQALWRITEGDRQRVFPTPGRGFYTHTAPWRPVDLQTWEAAERAIQRGLAQSAQGASPQALEAFEAALRIHPGRTAAHAHLAKIYAALGAPTALFRSLQALLENGRLAARRDLWAIRSDPAFTAFADDPQFQRLTDVRRLKGISFLIDEGIEAVLQGAHCWDGQYYTAPLLSTPDEQICVHLRCQRRQPELAEDSPTAIQARLFDCATGAWSAQVRTLDLLDPRQIDSEAQERRETRALLDDLEAIHWQTDEGDLHCRAAQEASQEEQASSVSWHLSARGRAWGVLDGAAGEPQLIPAHCERGTPTEPPISE